MDFSEYKVQSKEILKAIGIDDESSVSKADFEDDVGPSKNTRIVIIECDEEDDWSLFLITLGVFSKSVLTRFTFSLIILSPLFDSSSIKTLVNFMTVKYNPSLISCNKVFPASYLGSEAEKIYSLDITFEILLIVVQI